jgi:hypothetical protein
MKGKTKRRDILERELDELYSAPPDRFVETRKRLAAALRDSGRDQAAAQVRALRKPTVAAGAINRAVHANPQRTSDLVAAAHELRRAHARALEKRGADRRFLRDAVAQEREAVSAMADTAAETLEREGGSAGADVLRRIEETLGAVALDEGVMKRFARGRLEREARAAGLSLPVGKAAPAEERPSAAETKRQRQVQVKVRDAERELTRARRAVDGKQRAVDRARAQRDRADVAVDQADRQLRAAQAELERAERKVSRARMVS